jgi:hypothetical protein
VRELERALNHATRDPHGRSIPGIADLATGSAPFGPPEPVTGYAPRP